MTDNDALAYAWDAGFDAAADRAQRVVLLAATLGINEAMKQVQTEKPIQNPYRFPKVD